jgi:2-C-methyl-D-erythritol 4-phosphate cytidylyltransferase
MPILARTLIVFDNHSLIDSIVVTVPPGDEEFCRAEIVARFELKKVLAVVAGGRTRQQSVFNGLHNLAYAELVAIHDGVRPLISTAVMTETIRSAQNVGAAVACSPVKDTVKRKNGLYLETVPRSDLWLAHTPQTFRTSLIVEAHERALADGFEGTDDASLVERLGYPVAVVEDTEDNIKITTPADLERAAMILKRRSEAARGRCP